MPPEEPSNVPNQTSQEEPLATPSEPPAQTPALVSIIPGDSSIPPPPGMVDTPVPPVMINQPPVANKMNRKRNILLAVVIIVLLGLGGIGWQWQNQQNTPEDVFTGAISKLLSTKTITQSTSDGSSSEVINYDASNVKAPIVSVAISLKSSNLTNKLSGYGTLKDSYLKYTSFGSAAIDAKVPTLVNKWIQLRQNGVNLKGVDAVSEDLADPRSIVFGDLMIGNFTASDHQKLLDYIATNKVYKYDSSKVTTATVNGSKAYVYPLTENISKLKELNKKVAALMGIPAADIEPSLAQLTTPSNAKVYVDINTKQIVKYTATQDGVTATGSYSGYNTTSLPAQPKAAMTWEQFMQKQTDALDSLLGSGTSSSTPVSGAPVSQQV
jgi:hypothetical protein